MSAARKSSRAKASREHEPLRVMFGPGETGWVKLAAEGFSVCNIPMTGRLNYGDIVSLRLEPVPKRGRQDLGRMTVVDRVLRREYRRKAALWYDKPAQFKVLVKRLRAAGAMTEGAVEPSEGRRGFVLVAFNAPVDPVAIAREVGIVSPRSKERRS